MKFFSKQEKYQSQRLLPFFRVHNLQQVELTWNTNSGIRLDFVKLDFLFE